MALADKIAVRGVNHKADTFIDPPCGCPVCGASNKWKSNAPSVTCRACFATWEVTVPMQHLHKLKTFGGILAVAFALLSTSIASVGILLLYTSVSTVFTLAHWNTPYHRVLPAAKITAIAGPNTDAKHSRTRS